MKTIMGSLAALLLLFASAQAHAVITCNIVSNGFSTAYDPTSGLTNTTQTFFTVTCTKSATGDPSSVSFGVTADNGLYALGVNNRAAFGASRIRYDVFTNSNCSSTWKGSTAISGVVSTPSTGTYSATGNFWGCVGAGQNLPAGTYADTVAIMLTYGATSATSATSFGVSISTPASCSLSAAPGDVIFNYASFGALVNASSTFGVNCTTSLPYTMALDAVAGTIVGLNYTLALSTASSTGTGVQQTHSINGAMAAGQAGTCAAAICTASQLRTLTLTY